MIKPPNPEVLTLLFDLLRLSVFALFGVGLGFMIMTNCIAFMILRPPKKLGFLWWHVTAISLSFVCLGVVATERVVGSLGDPPGWRSILVLIGMLLFATAQVIIFGVERQRFITNRAMQVAISASPPGTFQEP